MKVNLVGTRRRWLFHLGTVFVFIAVIPCKAGVIVDIPAVSSETTIQPEVDNQPPQQHESPVHQHPHQTFQPPPISLGNILRQAYRSDKVSTEGIAAILKVSKSLSESCSRDVKRFVGQMMVLFGVQHAESRATTPETWALQMMDAWAKPPEGILSGHVNALGDFDECLAIRAANKTHSHELDFQGKYCLVYTIPNSNVDNSQGEATGIDKKVVQGERSPENLMKLLNIVGNAELPLIPSIGTCFPSTCSDQDVWEIVEALFSIINLKPVARFCSVDEPVRFSVGAIATITLLVVLVFLVVVGTMLEYAINHQYLDTFSQTKLFMVFHAFSLITNGRKFLNTETSKNDVNCLHGIRFLSASWVVLGHTYLMGIIQPLWNIVDTYTMVTSSLSMVIIINAAIVVDVFFVIGGFLVALTLMVMMEKSKGKLNVPLLYVGRYLRITPLYMIIVCIGTFIFPLMGSGPYWHVAKTWAGFCERNWWKNMLYINNLPIYDPSKDPNDVPCHGMAWYLGVDMQLFLLTPFILFPVWKWKRYGYVPLVLLTIVSMIMPGLLTYINNYAPTSVPFADRNSRYSQEAYTPTYMRATPYLVGMCTGLLFRANFKLPRTVVVGSWMVAFATGFAVLFSPQKFLDPEYNFQRGESAIYVSGQRTAWSLAISWLIFACGTGNGGWINQMLSWKPFVPLGRLTFSIYLVSMHLQFLFHLQYRQPIYFSNYHMVNLYFGHLVMSCVVALICTLVIEAPFMHLLKLILPTDSKIERSGANNDNNNNSNRSEDPTVKKPHDTRCSISPDPPGSESEVRSVTGSKDRLW